MTILRFGVLLQDMPSSENKYGARKNSKSAEFVSAFSHKARSPLSAALIHCGIIENGRKLSSAERESLEEIKNGIKAAAEMLGEYSLMSKLEDGVYEARDEIISLPTLAASIISELAPKAKERGIEVVLESDAIPDLRADGKLIRTAFKQVLDNAITFSKSGSKVKIYLRMKGGEALVTVEDNGTGISEDDKEKVFEVLYQGKNAAEGRPDGIGTGLYIAKMAVNFLGGTIEHLQNEPQGTIFRIKIPNAR